MDPVRFCPECGEGIEGYRGAILGGEVGYVRKWNQDIRACPNKNCDGEELSDISVFVYFIKSKIYNRLKLQHRKISKVHKAKEVYTKDNGVPYCVICTWE